MWPPTLTSEHVCVCEAVWGKWWANQPQKPPMREKSAANIGYNGLPFKFKAPRVFKGRLAHPEDRLSGS